MIAQCQCGERHQQHTAAQYKTLRALDATNKISGSSSTLPASERQRQQVRGSISRVEGPARGKVERARQRREAGPSAAGWVMVSSKAFSKVACNACPPHPLSPYCSTTLFSTTNQCVYNHSVTCLDLPHSNPHPSIPSTPSPTL